jgi:hypothetical protein
MALLLVPKGLATSTAFRRYGSKPSWAGGCRSSPAVNMRISSDSFDTSQLQYLF